MRKFHFTGLADVATIMGPFNVFYCMGILLVPILRLLEGGKRTDLAFTSLGNPMQGGGGTYFNNIL